MLGMSKKIAVTMTEDMHDAIKRQARKKGANKSALIRIAISSWLHSEGERVDPFMEWGGKRDPNGNQ